MAEQIEIQVTQRDIDRAKVKDSSRCVVATALARSVPGSTRVSVDVQTIRFTLGDERFVYLTPYTVAGYVVAFDAGDEIAPFKFRLRNDQMVRARKRLRTEAGKQRLRAGTNESRAVQQLDRAMASVEALADRSADLPPPTTHEVEEARANLQKARAKVDNAREERAAVMAAYEGAKSVTEDSSVRLAPPKVFKRSERTYGMRQLRINQHVEQRS